MALIFRISGVSRLTVHTVRVLRLCNETTWRCYGSSTRPADKLIPITLFNKTIRIIPFNRGKSPFAWNFVRNESGQQTKVRKPPRQPITWKTLAITVVLAGSLWAGMMYVKHEKELATQKHRTQQIGKAKIGGEWELMDHNGTPKSSKDFLGKWVLLYFGFTHCPDICPDEIEKMLEAAKLLRESVHDIKLETLFITVDPERDSKEAVARYVKEFSSTLLGLTGTKEQINKVAKQFRVYYSAGPPDSDDNDYIVDHTIIIYLIDPEGKFSDYYGQNKTAKQIAAHVEQVSNRFSYLRWTK